MSHLHELALYCMSNSERCPFLFYGEKSSTPQIAVYPLETVSQKGTPQKMLSWRTSAAGLLHQPTLWRAFEQDLWGAFQQDLRRAVAEKLLGCALVKDFWRAST